MSTPEHEQFAHLDGAYVLGALSPEERYDFEQHLRDCPECQANVGELAGLPGLLSKVPVEQARATVSEQPPPTLLPNLLQRASRERTRTRRTTVASWLATAAAVIALALVSIPWTGGQSAETFPTELTAMSSGMSTKMSAHVEGVAWGTQIDIQCDDRKSQASGYRAVFELVVITKSGDRITVGSWVGQPGKVTVAPSSTWIPLDDIQEIQIRSQKSDDALFWADLP